MDYAGAFSMESIQIATGIIFSGLKIRDQQFEEAFKSFDYESLENFLKVGKFRSEFVFYRSILELLRTNSSNTKSDEQSEFHRQNGKNLLKNMYDDEAASKAMCAYDMALCYAKTPNQKAKVYGKISDTYFLMNSFTLSLKHIDHAIKQIDKSDATGKEKLQKRKLKCQYQIDAESNENDARSPAQLSYPSNPAIPGLAAVLKRVNRSIFTTIPLATGDIIAKTSSFCLFNEPMFRRAFCNQCGCRTIGARGGVKIPCDFCSTTMFCGELCKVHAMKGFHGIECKNVPDFLATTDGGGIEYLAIKFAFKAMEILEHTNCEEKITCFDWKDGDAKNEEILLKTILNMKQANLPFKLMFPIVSYYIILMDKLKFNKRFHDFIARFDNGNKRLFDMYCNAYLVISQNCFFADYTLNIDWLFGNLQHSCIPNVMIIRDSQLGTNNYLVINDIAANGELTIAYG